MRRTELNPHLMKEFTVHFYSEVWQPNIIHE